MSDDQEFIEKRMESAIQTFNGLLLDFERKLLKSVDDKIDYKFNGKMEKLNLRMDKQDEILIRLDQRLQPFEETRNWFKDAKKGAGWLAGFLTSIGLICGAILYLFKFLKQ